MPAPSPAELLSHTIRRVIRERSLSASAVARSAGVSPSQIARFLSGERDLYLSTAERLLEVLGLKVIERGRRLPPGPVSPDHYKRFGPPVDHPDEE
jgi:transcriptional regulator with XRE-family HTH domain